MLKKIDRHDLRHLYGILEQESNGVIRLPQHSEFDRVYHFIGAISGSGTRFVDLGGGTNPVNAILVRLGATVHVLDIFKYDYSWKQSNGVDFESQNTQLKIFLEDVGVKFINADLCDTDLSSLFSKRSIDVITCTHCIEHFHHSPKKMLSSALEVLKENGRLWIEVPNAVNLLKRFRVLAGKTNYGSYLDFYSAKENVGHIREYTVGDLEILARQLGINDFSIFGRNYFGNFYHYLGYNIISRFIDKIIRIRPGLCGSIFLVADLPSKSCS